jgi:hypothetical protein
MTARVGSIVLFVTILVLGPALQSSEAGGFRPSQRDVVLYELNEQALLTPAGRWATSGLQGKAKRGTPLCPEGLMAYAELVFAQLGIVVKDTNQCSVVAVASSELDLTTFAGTIRGDFYVVVNTNKTNVVDAAEVVIMKGTFEGTIQVADREGRLIDIVAGGLYPHEVFLPGFPLPSPAMFKGKFRLPFKVHHVAVYQTDHGGIVPVRLDERALGEPTVRVEIRFDPDE